MRFWIYAALPALFSCAGGWDHLDRSTLPTAGAHPHQDAVTLQEQVTLRYVPGPNGPRLLRTTKKEVLVLKPKGSPSTRLMVGYARGFSTVVSAKARVIAPDGQTETFGLNDFGDHPAYGGSILYADNRLLEKDFGVLAPGTVVQWQVTVRSDTPSWQVSRYGFGGRDPVQTSRLIVDVPKGWSIEHTATQLWAPLPFEPQVEQTTEGQRYTWQREDLPAVKREPLAPGLWDVVPIVSVRLTEWQHQGQPQQAFASMEDYGRWMHKVQSGTDTPTPELTAQVQSVLQSTPAAPRDQAEALYRWVQDNIRYVAVEVGMGGWKPHSAQEVFEHGYGDCKDKANLLRTMLKVAKIDSNLAEIYSHAGLPRPFVFPGVGNGNHAILAVHLPEGTVMADPTERTVPFGALPPRDQGAQTLVIDAERPEIRTTAPLSAEQNVMTLRVALQVPSKGVAATGTTALSTEGAFAWYLRRAVITRAKGKESKTFEDWDWLRNSKVSEVKFLTDDPRHVEGRAKLEVSQLGTEAGARLIFRPSALLFTPGHDLSRSERTHPVIYSDAITRDSEVKLDLNGAQVDQLPDPVHLKSAFGEFEQRWSLKDGSLVVRSIFRRTTRRINAPDYKSLLSFVDQIIEARGQQVIIRREEKS